MTTARTYPPEDADLVWKIAVKRDDVFDGATTNAHGDKDGTDATHTLFTVTGDVIIKQFVGIVNTTLTEDPAPGGATLKVGVSGHTNGLLAQALALSLDDGGVWVNGGADAGVASSAAVMYIINDSLDIIETVATSDVDAGQIDYYCVWAALEAGASIVAT